MKKILLTLSLAFILVGCSESTIQNVTEKFLNDSEDFSITDNSYVTNSMAEKFSDEREDILDEILHSLGVDKSSVDLEEIDGYNTLLQNIEELKGKTKYEVNSVDVNDSNTKASVSLDIKYVDIGEHVVKDISLALDRSILKAYSGDEVNEKEFLTLTIESLNETLEEFEYDELTSGKGAKVNLIKKDRDWVINNIDEKALNAITLNFMSAKGELLDDKLHEVEDNRVFLETESNLRGVFKEVQNLINSDNNVTYDNLTENAVEISEVLSNKQDVNSVISDNPGKEDGVYYVTKGPSTGELTITLTRDDKKYVFSEKVK